MLAPLLVLPAGVCTDFDAALRREWLETNGLGSFACGTVAGAATRRYHALLCVASRPPLGRVVLVDDVEVQLEVAGATHELSTHLYPGVVYPEGYRALVGFRLDPWPIWTFRFGPLTVERELFMPHRLQATVLRFRLRGGAARLLIRPLLSGRDYHTTHHENEARSTAVAIGDRRHSLSPYPDLPELHLHHDGSYHHAPDWYRRFQLPEERARGLDAEQDLHTPGQLTWSLADGAAATIVLTTEPRPSFAVDELMATERGRRAAIRTITVPASLTGSERALVARLAAAADQFIVARGAVTTVIAGYPWFTDWGRDTFIALPGLALVTGRTTIARGLLAAFAPHIADGLIPNRFPDADQAPEYNSVDAPLWFVIAAGEYAGATGDLAFVRASLWPSITRVIEGYRRGTRYHIGLDHDGLVHAGEPGVQLTWMDAKVGDFVVTPRIGKPVEIQALWLRALGCASGFARAFGEAALGRELDDLAARGRASFADRFFYPAGGYLYDVIDGPASDASLRPNQLYALAVGGDGPPLIDAARGAVALEAVERHLLTPFGLRTLAPGDPAYRGRCTGSPWDRDTAYHQGTVWPHLLGVYADACRVVRGEQIGRRLAARLAPHLDEAGLGQVSEIFDGDRPHVARGCIAQAWAVAELLRLILAVGDGDLIST